MAFSDPQSVDYGAITVSLPRTGFGNGTGSFKSSDGDVKLTISHAYNKRTRHLARVDVQKVAADPLFPSTNVARKAAIYLVVDHDAVGFTSQELIDGVTLLTDWLTASSGAAITKVIGGEA